MSDTRLPTSTEPPETPEFDARLLGHLARRIDEGQVRKTKPRRARRTLVIATCVALGVSAAAVSSRVDDAPFSDPGAKEGRPAPQAKLTVGALDAPATREAVRVARLFRDTPMIVTLGVDMDTMREMGPPGEHLFVARGRNNCICTFDRKGNGSGCVAEWNALRSATAGSSGYQGKRRITGIAADGYTTATCGRFTAPIVRNGFVITVPRGTICPLVLSGNGVPDLTQQPLGGKTPRRLAW